MNMNSKRKAIFNSTLTERGIYMKCSVKTPRAVAGPRSPVSRDVANTEHGITHGSWRKHSTHSPRNTSYDEKIIKSSYALSQNQKTQKPPVWLREMSLTDSDLCAGLASQVPHTTPRRGFADLGAPSATHTVDMHHTRYSSRPLEPPAPPVYRRKSATTSRQAPRAVTNATLTAC